MFSEILDGDAYNYYSGGEWRKSSSGFLSTQLQERLSTRFKV